MFFGGFGFRFIVSGVDVLANSEEDEVLLAGAAEDPGTRVLIPQYQTRAWAFFQSLT